MVKQVVIWLIPILLTGIGLGIESQTSTPDNVSAGIRVGLIIALVQSLLSLGAMKLALRRSIFYWVWGGGMLFRAAVFGATAYIVHVHTHISLGATLISMVVATTVFIVVESMALFKRI